MTDVVIAPTAEDALESLPDDVKNRIKEKMLREVARSPDRYLKSLSNSPNSRVRVGDYRVIVNWNKADDQLEILDVGKRDNIYD